MPDQQVVAAFHEALLHQAITKANVTTSDGSMYLNSKLFSDEALTRGNWLKWQVQVGYPLAFSPALDKTISKFPWRNFFAVMSERSLIEFFNEQANNLGNCWLDLYTKIGSEDRYFVKNRTTQKVLVNASSFDPLDFAKKLEESACD